MNSLTVMFEKKIQFSAVFDKKHIFCSPQNPFPIHAICLGRFYACLCNKNQLKYSYLFKLFNYHQIYFLEIHSRFCWFLFRFFTFLPSHCWIEREKIVFLIISSPESKKASVASFFYLIYIQIDTSWYYIKLQRQRTASSDLFAQRILKSACASTQSVHFVICMKKLCILGYLNCAQWRFWSDCANAQADLNLRWAHMSDVWFLTWLIGSKWQSFGKFVCVTVSPSLTHFSVNALQTGVVSDFQFGTIQSDIMSRVTTYVISMVICT